MTTMSGGCACGAVRYRLSSEPTEPSICHCRMCQKAFGSYVAPLASVPAADLTWTRGEPGVFRSSEAVERGFCRDCGTPLTYNVVEQDKISISIGSLDDPDQVPPSLAYGLQGKRAVFAALNALPGTRTEDDTDPALMARLKSRQHPDHDTAVWPPCDLTPAVSSKP